MSVTGYFSNTRDPRMPKADAQPDSLGIVWQGQVLDGSSGVREAIDHSHIQAMHQGISFLQPNPLHSTTYAVRGDRFRGPIEFGCTITGGR